MPSKALPQGLEELIIIVSKGGLQLSKGYCKLTSNPSDREQIIDTPITYPEGFRPSLFRPVQIVVIIIV